MKQLNFKYLGALLVCVSMILGACTKNSEEYAETTLTLNATEIIYDENDIWEDAYDNNKNIVSQTMNFSHNATVGDGYKVWSGFVASRNRDNKDYSGNFLDHQWSVMSQGGMSGVGTPYLVACWNTSENTDLIPDHISCYVNFEIGGVEVPFKPQSMYVNNNSYAYYTIINGDNFCRKFKNGDYFKLKAFGLRANGELVGPVEFYLADYRDGKTEIVKDWTFVNLDNLGEVVKVYFQMESTDSSVYGMNTPAYFCLDRLRIRIE